MQSQPDQKETGRPNRRRRRLIVDKPFQYRLIGLLLGIWAGNTLFFSLILYFFYRWHILRFYDLVPRAGIEPLVSAPTLFSIAIAFVCVFGLVVIAIVGVYLSNQIAGPLYRVKHGLDRMIRGDVNFEIHFRDRDFLEDFPEYFNNMLYALREQAEGEVETLKGIEANLDNTPLARVLLRDFCQQKQSRIGLTLESEEPASPSLPTDDGESLSKRSKALP